MLVVDFVRRVLADEDVELLDGGNNNFCVFVFELFFEFFSVCVAVGCSLLEFVILFNCLVVEVFSVNDEEDFFDVRQIYGELSGFEGG